ncbi:MAG: response regulator [Candidatus Eisenbacteria bacterium]|nr:response regulator [Candidatus Latescibacterota bacterium]MBD3301400.1 response regulator [Candidatus Eisenbacteria bacterium]
MRIILIDDHEEIRETFGELLSEEGYRVTCCATGMSALVRIGAERPDLVLLDLNLGDLSGFDVLRTLRADPELGRTPVLFISGVILDQELLRERTGDPGARLLLKPVDPAILLEEIRQAIGGDGR